MRVWVLALTWPDLKKTECTHGRRGAPLEAWTSSGAALTAFRPIRPIRQDWFWICHGPHNNMKHFDIHVLVLQKPFSEQFLSSHAEYLCHGRISMAWPPIEPLQL
jgi:hypothetical protein